MKRAVRRDGVRRCAIRSRSVLFCIAYWSHAASPRSVGPSAAILRGFFPVSISRTITPSCMNSLRRERFAEINYGRMLLRPLTILRSIRGGHDDNGNLREALGRPQPLEDGLAVIFGKMHVQEQQVRPRPCCIVIGFFDE